jgi:hypothetical protein
MSKPTPKIIFLLTATLVTAVSAFAAAPATAGTINHVSIGGTAATDYLLYNANATNTFLAPNASLQSILGGSGTSPTGNVELAASSEKAGFDFSKTTTLNGTIGGRAIAISSLTAADWTNSYKGSTFGRYWFDQALSSNQLSLAAPTANLLFNVFQNNGGFQRFSDPNISYVNQDDTTGQLAIGLAGHFNASALFTKSIDQYMATTPLSNSAKQQMLGLKTQIASKPIQASEVFKYSYNNQTDYGYSFKATQSGLVEVSDGVSHSGNYEVVIAGPPAHVPEPAIGLGLAAVIGMVRKTRRRIEPV